MKDYFNQLAQDIKVLYVEDDDDVRESTENLLKLIFPEVISAVNGLDGLEKFQELQGKIDLIITDIYMPKLSGFEMIEEIKQIDATANILVLSSYDDIVYMKKAINLSVDGYLTKPFDFHNNKKDILKALQNIKLKKELINYQNGLVEKIEEQKYEIKHKDEILQNQAKLATMGEMIDIIAHQWQQPLNTIAMRVSFLAEYTALKEKITQEDIMECHDKVKDQIVHLVETLNQFRGFFRSKKYIGVININEIYNGLSLLLKDELIKNEIVLEKEFDDNIIFNGNINEIKHIFINLINNAKDAFNINKIKGRKILLKAEKLQNIVRIKLRDNAGGISEELRKRIFDINFTTKKEIGGTGIGLYLCKMIAEKHNAVLSVNSEDDMTEFILDMPI